MLALVRAASGIDLGHWLPAVTARTLVLAGAADQAGARAASDLAGRISGARLETIAGEGADLPRTATAAFNDALYAFLDD